MQIKKINRLLISLLSLTSAAAFAVDNDKFQHLDRQMSIGYGLSEMTLANGQGKQSLLNNQSINLDVERLFTNGIWTDINVNFLIYTDSLGDKSAGVGQNGKPLTQNPYVAGLNAKVGYAYPLMDQTFQVTPYALVGRNTNLAQSTLNYNGAKNATNSDYFYTGGIGGRLEYLATPEIDIYLDQAIAYNWDQSGPTLNGAQPQNNMIYTTTLGVKYNPYEQLIIGANLSYNSYQGQATPLPDLWNPTATTTVYQPQSSFGGMITVGMTY